MDVLLPATSRTAGRRARAPHGTAVLTAHSEQAAGNGGWLPVSNVIFNSQFLSLFCCLPALSVFRPRCSEAMQGLFPVSQRGAPHVSRGRGGLHRKGHAGGSPKQTERGTCPTTSAACPHHSEHACNTRSHTWCDSTSCTPRHGEVLCRRKERPETEVLQPQKRPCMEPWDTPLCTDPEALKDPEAAVGRTPTGTLASSNLPDCHAEPCPTALQGLGLHKHQPFPLPGHETQTAPIGSCFFLFFFFFLLYQDLAEIDRVLSEWVMFAQRFVNATPYVRAQVCSRGLPGQHACALPSAIRAPRASREHQLPSLKVH